VSCTLPTIGELRERLRPAVAATGIADPLEAARKASTSLVFNYDRHSVELDESDLRAIRDGFTGAEHVIGRRDFWRLGREFSGLDRVEPAPLAAVSQGWCTCVGRLGCQCR
jgi:hypothetical protein